MSDDKTPLEEAVDQAVEAFVYAPIGLIFDGPALFPDLVERGKTQVKVARMMGQMAVQTGQSELSKRLDAASSQAPGPVRDVLGAFGLVRNDKPAATKTTAATDASGATDGVPAGTAATKKRTPVKRASTSKATSRATNPARGARKAATKATSSVASATAAAAAALSIPEYDSLSASQVVQRLRGLAPTELEAVKAYEASNRARKTILNKIAQLQKD